MFFFWRPSCKCKRISCDESHPINSFNNVAEFLLPALSANYLKWNTIWLHFMLCSNLRLKPTFSSKTGHAWGCVMSPKKEQQKLDLIFSLSTSLVFFFFFDVAALRILLLETHVDSSHQRNKYKLRCFTRNCGVLRDTITGLYHGSHDGVSLLIRKKGIHNPELPVSWQNLPVVSVLLLWPLFYLWIRMLCGDSRHGWPCLGVMLRSSLCRSALAFTTAGPREHMGALTPWT